MGLVLATVTGCGRPEAYPNRPITLICPWGQGGGTDRVSRQMAEYLKIELGVPVNVVNATGGKGVTGHSRGLSAAPDGYTITMITLELNMMHWSGLTHLTPADCQPLMSINEDYCALFVRAAAPWQTLSELEQAIREKPGQLKASGTASGGAWHLAVAGWLIAQGKNAEDVIWISSTGAAPSLQELLSGGVDMVACSLPEARTLYDSGQVRALGVMAPQRTDGFDQVKTFIEQGTDWSLGGWRGLAVPLGTPPVVVDRLLQAIERIVTGKTQLRLGTEPHEEVVTFPEFMQQQGFDSTWRRPAPFREFLSETDEKLGRLLTSDAMRSVNTDRFSPMAFPRLLLIWLAVTSLGLVAARLRRGARVTDSTPTVQRPRRAGVIRFSVFVGAMVVYLLTVETVGFVLTTGVILFLLLWLLGNRMWISVAIASSFTPLVYWLFASVLRVPLPPGWLGW